jgi:hypothetical protein
MSRKTGRVYISRDVVFDETVFPFKSLHPNAGALLRKEIMLLPEPLQPTSIFDHGGVNSVNQRANPANTIASVGVQNLQKKIWRKTVQIRSKLVLKQALDPR